MVNSGSNVYCLVSCTAHSHNFILRNFGVRPTVNYGHGDWPPMILRVSANNFGSHLNGRILHKRRFLGGRHSTVDEKRLSFFMAFGLSLTIVGN